ncbi:unnamed protein product [Closterium sp. Naga37s-1]|nr:unnamed protein product [Closterium sp. Naga37s-1]
MATIAAGTAVPTAALTASRAASAASASTSFARSAVPAPLPAPLSAAPRAVRTHLLRCRAAAVEDGAVKEVAVEAEELSNGAAVAAPTVDEVQSLLMEVQSLLMELCDETHIAELKVKVGAFSLHVKRDVDGSIGHAVAAAEASAAAAAAPVVYAAPVPAFPMAESLPAAEPVAEVAAEPEKPKDEGLVYVTSPRVGIMRRGKLYKGKHGRPIVLEGAVVKKGQAMCFLEQLGTNLTIEVGVGEGGIGHSLVTKGQAMCFLEQLGTNLTIKTEHAGTVVDFLVEDGVPVGYGEPLAAIRPSFPGIMKLT